MIWPTMPSNFGINTAALRRRTERDRQCDRHDGSDSRRWLMKGVRLDWWKGWSSDFSDLHPLSVGKLQLRSLIVNENRRLVASKRTGHASGILLRIVCHHRAYRGRVEHASRSVRESLEGGRVQARPLYVRPHPNAPKRTAPDMGVANRPSAATAAQDSPHLATISGNINVHVLATPTTCAPRTKRGAEQLRKGSEHQLTVRTLLYGGTYRGGWWR